MKRLIAPPPTPMCEDFSLDLSPIERQVELLVESGVSGAFVCGSTGESLSLTVEERKAVAEEWVRLAQEKLQVIVHVGHNALPAAVELAAHAQRIGAGAIAAMPPCYFKPRAAEAVADWCTRLASAAPDLPFYYYHIPAMSGVHIRVSDLLRIAAERIPKLTGVKYTWEDLSDFALCVGMEGGRFEMLFGRDQMLLGGLAMGARGAIGSTYNFAAPLYLGLIEAFEAGEMERARSEQRRATRLILTLARHGGPEVFKAVMKLVGLDLGPSRPPLPTLTPEQLEALRADLESIGFFDYCSQASRASGNSR